MGDVGDFGKFALLRRLCSSEGDAFKLGIVWCYFPDESHNGDGRHLRYLAQPSYLNLDPELHAALGELVKSGNRSLSSIEAAGILRKGTLFFHEPTSGKPISPALRAKQRSIWHDHALAATREAEIVFFDPDNGLEAPSVPMTHPKAGKYIFWNELVPFWRRGQSLVVYHHLNRIASATVQTETLRARFSEKLGDIPWLAPLLFRRGSCRHFWVVGQSEHASKLERLMSAFLAAGWGQHFDAAFTPAFKRPLATPLGDALSARDFP